MPHLYLFLLCCCSLYSTASLPAQSPLGNSYAYFFYTTDFLPGWENLPETATEAKAIGEILDEQYDFEVKYIPNPDKGAILSEITKINSRRYEENDQVLFFFSMHGHFDRAADRGYLIPADGKIPSRDPYGQSWISYDDLGSYITKNPAEHILLALDACYSGAFGDRYRGRPDAAPWQQEGNCREKARQALAYDSRLYFSSGSREQRTPARSLFAKKWLEALRNGAQSGLVRFNDLRYYLGDISYPVPEGGSFTGRHKAGGDFVFLHRSACVGASIPEAPLGGAEEEFWQQMLRLNTKEAYNIYLQAYPQGKYRKQANDKLELLKQAEKENSAPANSSKKPASTSSRELLDMIFVQGGAFQMGSKGSEASKSEQPVHSVTVDDFYMHRHEVTFEEYDQFCEATNRDKPDDEGWGRGKHPVINVSWYDALAYCNWLSDEHFLKPVYMISSTSVSANWNANGYRLPTEAEWEFAARSRGGSDKWAGTSSESVLFNYANYLEGASKDGYEKTAPVGSFRANGLGLYDMSGNVWEWCWDWYDGDYYKKISGRNPLGPVTGSNRVGRGGSWVDDPRDCRAASRLSWAPMTSSNRVGFRLARTVTLAQK